MKTCGGDFDLLDRLLEAFSGEGTHPDFPVRKPILQKDRAAIPWSELAFELPALVVYGAEEGGAGPVAGLVVALSHLAGGTRILVRSKHGGKSTCHPIEESPSGLKPSYFLLKKRLPMAGIP